ncbi:MAG: pantoate kinase [Candidatus Methanomethylicaceae archaeon]
MQTEALLRSTVHAGEAYAPGHITGFFSIHLSEDPIFTGSIGAGICLEVGVKTRVRISESTRTELSLTWNGLPLMDSPLAKSVIKRMLNPKTKLSVIAEQRSLLPINYGYGISGASALSFALALNKAMGSPLPLEKIGEIAHLAEVENMTGLGDVSAQIVGGFEVRLKPGAPTIGKVQRLPDPKYFVITTPVKPMRTSRMISDPNLRKRINEKGETCISAFMNDPTVEALMALSKDFWKDIGFLDMDMAKIIKKYEPLGIKLISLKKGLVYGLVHEDELPKVIGGLPENFLANKDAPLLIHNRLVGMPLILSKISTRGAH